MAHTIRYSALDKPPNVPSEVGAIGIDANIRFVSMFRFLTQLGAYLLKISDVVNNTLRGKLNCTSDLVLLPNVAITTISNPNIGGDSTILPSPTTANAAAELPTLYFDTFLKGSCVAHHTNSAVVDRIFSIAIIG
jgi:hypothetical protein